MRKIFVAIGLLVWLAGAAWADTLYLKNGSVLKGRFIGFENNQFIFELDNGRRLTFRPTEVSRLVLDHAPNNPNPDDRPPVPSRPGGGNTGGWETLPAFDVRLENQWTRSPVQVVRGQRVRVTATGTIYLEGRTSTGPEGLSGRRDQDAPLPTENDGALIAAIGQDPNSPAFLIGRSREFVAESDGLLYFTVNHWETRDARGQFRVNVSVDRRSGGIGDGGSGTGPGGAGQGREKTVTVYANREWTDTGIDVEPGMTFEITASGEVQIGNRRRVMPNGDRNASGSSSRYPMPDEGAGGLIAKIRYRDGRDSNYLFVGERNQATAEPNEYGRLFLGINDDNFRDNSGSFTVRIRW